MAEQLVADAFSEEGVKGLVELISEREDDVEVLTAAFELLASSCAGSEDARGLAYASDALVKALSSMKLFEWQPALQAGAIKFLANMAADYAKPAGKQGAVESIVSTMRASADSYQVQLHGVRALSLLIKERDNLVRARAAGADDVISMVLDMHASDGQLVFRATDLQGRLETITEAEATEAVARVPESSKNPWSRLKQAVFTGQAKKISEGMLPGMHGISGQVAAKMQEGVEPLLNYMVERMRSAEAVRWCCDALATMCAGNGERSLRRAVGSVLYGKQENGDAAAAARGLLGLPLACSTACGVAFLARLGPQKRFALVLLRTRGLVACAWR